MARFNHSITSMRLKKYSVNLLDKFTCAVNGFKQIKTDEQ